jgi:hypothetical protein
LVRDFVEHSVAAGQSASATAARLKQWFQLANHDGRLPWSESLKLRQSLEDLLDHLSQLAES